MRMGLLSDIAIMGYELYLEGNQIRYRYMKPGNPPEKAVELINELRQCKQEAIKILASAKRMAIWPNDMHELIDWFMALEPPAESFYLEPHIRVIQPEKYFQSLRREIEGGPISPRGRNGALLYDLNILRKILH